MRGINTEKPIPYILEEDRGLPESEQTVFYINLYSALNTARMERRFAKSERINRAGQAIPDAKMRTAATVETFIEFCDHIENFFFYGEEKGTDISPTDEHGKQRVASQLSPKHLTELLEFATGNAGLDDAEKKPLNSQPTSPSGKKTTTKTQ